MGKSFKNNIFLVDVDGVLLKWVPAFDKYMSKKGIYPITEKQQDFDLSTYYALPKNIIYDEVNKFNNGHWRFGTLDPYPDAVNGVKYIHDTLGFKFVAITSSSTKSQSIALRRANLFNVFGDVFYDVHCVDVEGDKTEYLALYKPTYWVEDKPKNCLIGLEYGHDCILMNRNHNKKDVDSRWTRCYNWREIIRYIEK